MSVDVSDETTIDDKVVIPNFVAVDVPGDFSDLSPIIDKNVIPGVIPVDVSVDVSDVSPIVDSCNSRSASGYICRGVSYNIHSQ